MPKFLGKIINSSGGLQFPDATLQTTAATGGGGAVTVQEEGVALTSRAILNFIGPGVTAVDNAGATRTDITIPSAGVGTEGTVSTGAQIWSGNKQFNGLIVANSGFVQKRVTPAVGAFPYTVLATDYVVAVTDTTAARVINLPAASAFMAGQQLIIQDESASAQINNITINRAGTDTVDGVTTAMINANYDSIRIYSDGVSKWFSMGDKTLATPSIIGLVGTSAQTFAGDKTFNGFVNMQGGFVSRRNAPAVGAFPYTAVKADFIIAVTDTSAARTVTLPAAYTLAVGTVYQVSDESGAAGTNNITIARTGTDTIEGATSAVIASNYGDFRCYTDGVSKWFSSGTLAIASATGAGAVSTGVQTLAGQKTWTGPSIFKTVASQTLNNVECRDSANTLMAQINPFGQFQSRSFESTSYKIWRWQTNVGVISISSFGAGAPTVNQSGSSITYSYGDFLQYSTPATINTTAGWTPPSFFQTSLQLRPIVTMLVTFNSTTDYTTSGIAWFGLTSAAINNALTANNLQCLMFKMQHTDTNVKVVVNNGAATAPAAIDTGVAINATGRYLLRIDASTLNSIRFYINGSLVATVTTGIPSDSWTYGLNMTTFTSVATSRSISLSLAQVEQIG